MNIKEIEACIKEGEQNLTTLNCLKTYISYLIQEEREDEIEKYLNRAVKLAGDLQLPREEGTLLIELGVHYWNQLDYKSALNMFRLSCGIFKQSKNEYDLVIATHNVGETYTKIGDYNNAISFLKLSLDFLTKVKGHEQKEIDELCADINNSLGTAYRKCKSFALSMSTYFKALELLEKHDLRMKICSTNLNIGKMFIDIGNFERALRYFNRSLEISIILNDIPLKSQTHALIAKLYRKNAKFSQAIPFYKDALAYLGQNTSKLLYHRLRTIYQLALTYFDLKDYENVIITCSEGLLLFKEHEFNVLQGKINYLLGLTYDSLENYTQAKENLQSALLVLAPEDTVNSLKYKILKVIAAIYQKENDYPHAYESLVKANQYIDLLIQEKQDKALAELEAKYESQQKVREEIMLKKANQEVAELKEQVANLTNTLEHFTELEHFFGVIPKDKIMQVIKEKKEIHNEDANELAVVKMTLKSEDELTSGEKQTLLKDISKLIMFYIRNKDEVGFWGDDSLVIIFANVKATAVDKVIEKIKLPIYNDILRKSNESKLEVDFTLMD